MRDLRDIERKRNEEERERIKKKISDDIVDVTEDTFNKLEDFFKRKNIEQDLRYKKRPLFLRVIEKCLWWIFGIGLLILLFNFILGNIWLLKVLIRSLFLEG